MRGKGTYLLLGFVFAAIGLAHLFARAESSRHKDRPAGTDSGMKAGQMTGQNSMQQMTRTMMSGVVPAGIKPGNLPAPGSEGAKLVARYCVQCHNLPSPLMHSAAEWPGVAARMFQRMKMCSRMSSMGMMQNMGGMGMMKGTQGGASGNGMMGMMNVRAPSAKEQQIIVSYLKDHSLKSIQPGDLPTPKRAQGFVQLHRALGGEERVRSAAKARNHLRRQLRAKRDNQVVGVQGLSGGFNAPVSWVDGERLAFDQFDSWSYQLAHVTGDLGLQAVSRHQPKK